MSSRGYSTWHTRTLPVYLNGEETTSRNRWDFSRNVWREPREMSGTFLCNIRTQEMNRTFLESESQPQNVYQQCKFYDIQNLRSRAANWNGPDDSWWVQSYISDRSNIFWHINHLRSNQSFELWIFPRWYL